MDASVGMLGHRPGLHVEINLEGRTVGGVVCAPGTWASGVVVGSGAHGDSLTIRLDAPIGGGEPRGLLRRPARGQDMVSVDDPSRIRAKELGEVAPGGIPEEIVALARAGKTLEAIRRYRKLNGATLEEARAAVAAM